MLQKEMPATSDDIILFHATNQSTLLSVPSSVLGTHVYVERTPKSTDPNRTDGGIASSPVLREFDTFSSCSLRWTTSRAIVAVRLVPVIICRFRSSVFFHARRGGAVAWTITITVVVVSSRTLRPGTRLAGSFRRWIRLVTSVSIALLIVRLLLVFLLPVVRGIIIPISFDAAVVTAAIAFAL